MRERTTTGAEEDERTGDDTAMSKESHRAARLPSLP